MRHLVKYAIIVAVVSQGRMLKDLFKPVCYRMALGTSQSKENIGPFSLRFKKKIRKTGDGWNSTVAAFVY
jgi:hypothetical protein